MSYMHGIRIQENPTNIPTPVKNEAGVPVIFGTAPVNLVADPEGAVNKLFLCNTLRKQRRQLVIQMTTAAIPCVRLWMLSSKHLALALS